MHKELIKKYKAEFNHWLNDGKLQAKFNGNSWIEAPKDIFAFNYVANFILVIDDEFVEFRKALAEGKTIQMYCKYDGVPPFWDDMTEVIKSIGFVMAKDNYRIKPEEPKFKVGDWVVYTGGGYCEGEILQITDIDEKGFCTFGSYDKLYHFNKLRLWQPKLGELVIFKDKNSIVSIIKYNGETNVYPFIGEITWLHKKD